MKYKYIFINPFEEWGPWFYELQSEEHENLTNFPGFKVFHNNKLKYLEYLIVSERLGKRITTPFKRLVYNLNNLRLNDSEQYFFLFPSATIWGMRMDYLEAYKRRHDNVKYAAILIDSFHAKSPHMNHVREKLFSTVWDVVLTFDQRDAQEFGFRWLGYSYYSEIKSIEAHDKQSDLYYVGYLKGREKTIGEIYNKMMQARINCDFCVVDPDTEKQTLPNTGLILKHKAVPYEDVLQHVKSSNCILEILQKGQNAQTARYFEAVIYNKKLLTNYHGITELPFYNADYMKVFDTADDIDPEWVRSRESINYNYNGMFSPLNILKMLEDT